MGSYLESLWKFYEEHAAQARQHEDQREHMTNIALVLAGALAALLSTDEAEPVLQLVASLSLVAIGIYTWSFSLKHYERNRLHSEILAEIRGEIDKELAGTSQRPTLSSLRNRAEVNHYSHHPKPQEDIQRDATSRVARARLYFYWAGLPILVACVGLAFAVFLAWKMAKL